MKAFFDSIKVSLFNGKLNQGQVDTINAIFASCEKFNVTDKYQIAYIFATARHESYHPVHNPTWEPVREGFAKTNAGAISAVTALYKKGKIRINYALPKPNGKSYYGRGYVQITWDYNYKDLGKRLGIDLYNNPDLALNPKIAADIMVVGMKEGLFTGRKLSDHFKDSANPFVSARAIINGSDQATLIAGYAVKFYNALIKI